MDAKQQACAHSSLSLACYFPPFIKALGNSNMFSMVSKMNNSIKVGYLYLLLGVLMFLFGLYTAKSTSDFIDSALSAKGTVIELIRKDDTLYPIVSFNDETGKTHTFESNYGCNPACYKEQDQVTVLYSDGNDKDPKVSGLMSLWLPSMLLIGIGISFVSVSLFQIKRLRDSTVQTVT